VTWNIGTRARIRFLLQASGDPASTAYRLDFQKNGAGGYVVVPVVSSVSAAYGTVTFGAIGTGANGSTTVAPSYPTGITAGQYLTCVVTSGATNSETPSTPSGWTSLATGASTDGTYGVDAGPRRVTVFGKEADGTESGTLTVSITNGGTCRGTISRWTKAGSGAWQVVGQGGNDSTSGTGFSAATASMNWNTGDATLVAVGQRVDTVTQSSKSLTASGVTFGATTNRADTAVTTGNDHRHVVDTFAACTSTSNVNAAPTWAYTGSAACSGGLVIVRLREYTSAATNEVWIDASGNIAASAATSTTAQLTGGSGTFVAGSISDDTNPLPSVDIGADGNTELEWCVNTQSPAVNTDYFDFRVTANGTALDTYTATPRLTLGTGGSAITSAPGAATNSQLTGSATAVSAITAAAGSATNSQLTGSAVVGAAISAAAGAATASLLVGSTVAVSSITAAAGVATASGLTGTKTASASITAAAGAATSAQLTGSSVAVSAITAAAGSATNSQLTGSSGVGSSISAAAGIATTSVLTGSAIATASITGAAGAATSAQVVGSAVAASAITAAAGSATNAQLTGSAATGSSITAAAGAATSSQLAGGSIAVATISTAAGVATASGLTGTKTAAATITAAAGAATSGTLTGTAGTGSTMSAAAGVATASTLTATSTATASLTSASGAATVSALAGSATARSSITAATGTSSAGTLSGQQFVPGSTVTPAAGLATNATLVGTAISRASIVAVDGFAIGQILFSPPIGTPTSSARWFQSNLQDETRNNEGVDQRTNLAEATRINVSSGRRSNYTSAGRSNH
jgi:hypothetical protein